MSETKKITEFHDPDYKQFHPKQLSAPHQPIVNETNPTQCESSLSSKPKTKPTSPESRRKAICRVIDTEFQRELKSKEDEVDQINRRLEEAKQLLAKVRYAVVHHYYSKKSLMATPDETALVVKTEQQSMTNLIGPNGSGKAQMPIHPSLKKLLGKRPIDYNEILKTRSPRQAAKNATQQFHKLAKKPKETIVKIGEGITIPSESVVEENKTGNENKPSLDTEQISKKPRYVAPSLSTQNIQPVNSARGRNHFRHLLVVGNTSKYIGDEEVGLATNVTHKWLVYVTAKTEVPVENIVKSVRFFLHESYKPNHVVDVSSSPFKLAKRGWGEFPIRVQLHFHDHLLQKPLQIFHTLVLDKKHSGLQTMGAETIVELWLNIPNTLNNSDSECSKSQEQAMTPILNEPIEQKSQPSFNSDTTKNPCEEFSLMQPIKQEIEPMPQQSENLPEQLLQNSVSDTKPISHQNPDCDQTKPTATTLDPTKSKPTLIALPKISPSLMNGPGKKLIKCVTKDGKVLFLQLVQDPINPKLFKMVLPKAPATNQTETLQKLNLVKLSNNPQLVGLKSVTNMRPHPSPIQTTTTARPTETMVIKSNPLKRANTTPLPTTISNKMTAIDLNQKPQSQQRSLLKRQVSLLKSSTIKSHTSVISPNKNNGKMITVSNIPGLENKNINIYLPTEGQPLTSSKAPFDQSHIKLQERFLISSGFLNMTDAISWLLREIPLIDSRAEKSEFKDLFPFVVPSSSIFNSFTITKQRNYEWLRAKYISRLIAKHKQFTDTRKWSTKEIVIYGRCYGYTPPSVIVKKLPDPNAEENVRDIVKTELIKEHLQDDMISFNTRLANWIKNFDITSIKGPNILSNDEIITVDIDDPSEKMNKSQEDLKRKKDSLPHLLVQDKYQNELMLVNDICRRHQIHCEPEEIDDGILHRSSELALVVALRSFVEDLIRKSFGAKAKITTSESSPAEIKTDDILQTISRTQNFDFLTNKNLGIHRSDCK